MEMNNSPWPGRPGVIPVTSGNAEDANRYNRAYLDRIHVEMRVIDSTEVTLEKEIFGKKYASPILRRSAGVGNIASKISESHKLSILDRGLSISV